MALLLPLKTDFTAMGNRSWRIRSRSTGNQEQYVTKFVIRNMTCYAFMPDYFTRGGCDQHLPVNRSEIEDSIFASD